MAMICQIAALAPGKGEGGALTEARVPKLSTRRYSNVAILKRCVVSRKARSPTKWQPKGPFLESLPTSLCQREEKPFLLRAGATLVTPARSKLIPTLAVGGDVEENGNFPSFARAVFISLTNLKELKYHDSINSLISRPKLSVASKGCISMWVQARM
jgi:hypothetical protein